MRSVLEREAGTQPGKAEFNDADQRDWEVAGACPVLIEATPVVTYTRVLIGFVVGLGIGLVFTVIVIAAKVGFFVDTPRNVHPILLIAFFVVPTVAGGLIGLLWRRSR